MNSGILHSVSAAPMGRKLAAILLTACTLTSAPTLASTFTINLTAGAGANPVHGGRWVVDVTYDPTTKLLSFKIVKSNPGEETYNGWTWTVPATLQLDGTVKFDGTSNVPTKGDGSPGSPGDKIDFNGTSYDQKKGKLKISSVDSGGFNFPIKGTSLVRAPKNPNNAKSADTSVPKDKSIDFNATTGLLSITGSEVVGTPQNTDPLLGASVTYPEFSLAGFNSEADAYIFMNEDLSEKLTLSNGVNAFETSTISALYYDVSDNLFYGVPSASVFSPDGSPFVQSISDALNPSGPLYDPIGIYYLEIRPDSNFGALTQGFETSYDTGGTDYHFIADGVPEPATWEMMLLGLAGLGLANSSRRAGRRPVSPKHPEARSLHHEQDPAPRR